MPQDLSKLVLSGFEDIAKLLQTVGHFYNAVALSEKTHFNFLGDIIAIPPLKPLASVYSIGDVFFVWVSAFSFLNFLKRMLNLPFFSCNFRVYNFPVLCLSK